MGCLGRLVQTIFIQLTIALVGLATRLSILLIGLVLTILFRIALFLIGWMIISLIALRSPVNSARIIVDQIVERLLQININLAKHQFLLNVLFVLVVSWIAVGWVLFFLTMTQLAHWIVAMRNG